MLFALRLGGSEARSLFTDNTIRFIRHSSSFNIPKQAHVRELRHPVDEELLLGQGSYTFECGEVFQFAAITKTNLRSSLKCLG